MNIPESFGAMTRDDLGPADDVDALMALVSVPTDPHRPGRKRTPDAARSAVAIAMLLDGETKPTLELLARVAGIDTSVACRRAQYGRSVIERTPELRSRLRGCDKVYLAKRYNSYEDASVVEFIGSIKTRRRRRA